MYESNTRDKVLKKIRQALLHKSPSPFPEPDFTVSVFESNHDSPEIEFAEKFAAAGGHFIFCENQKEFAADFTNLCSQQGWKKIICRESFPPSMLDSHDFPPGLLTETGNEADAVLTSCEMLIALTGSIMIASKSNLSLLASHPDASHIIVAYSHQ